MVHSARFRWPLAAALALGYVVVGAAACGGLLVLRSSVLEQESTAAASKSWKQWKAETERISREQGPLVRRPVKSDEPPALILLRDYFGNIVAAVLTILAGVLVFVVIVLWSRLWTP